MMATAINLQLTWYEHKLTHYSQTFKPNVVQINPEKTLKTSDSHNHHLYCIPVVSVCVIDFRTVFCSSF